MYGVAGTIPLRSQIGKVIASSIQSDMHSVEVVDEYQHATVCRAPTHHACEFRARYLCSTDDAMHLSNTYR